MPVGLVAFLVVRHEVVQGEAIVGCDVIDALVRMKRIHSVIRKQVIAAIKALHEGRHEAGITPHEAAHVVTEPAVPLKPPRAGEAVAQLIRPRGVPRLGDQADVRQVGVREDVAEDRRVLQVERSVIVAREDRGQIKPKAIDVHVPDPVAQAVHNHLADVAVAAVQGIPRS